MSSKDIAKVIDLIGINYVSSINRDSINVKNLTEDEKESIINKGYNFKLEQDSYLIFS